MRVREKVKPEFRAGLPRVVLLAYLLGFWRFIRAENPWVGDSHSVYFRLFRYRFELGKLAKHSPGVFGLASPQIESYPVFCRRISEVCPEYVLGFRTLCNEPGLRRFQSVYKVEPLGYILLLSVVTPRTGVPRRRRSSVLRCFNADDFVPTFGSPMLSRLCLHWSNTDAAQPPRFGPSLRCSNAVTTVTYPEEVSTANGPADVREHVTLLNREIVQQPEQYKRKMEAWPERYETDFVNHVIICIACLRF
ncbi:hypothetical protein PIB30_061737 [Stylosanthes scabra]|uniref:Uncharacterized protein n=1 Tax=Stylosanthes scabra TaxID=79078 RepID=A0ABU6QKJ7_9FABA|nr:hypothetical protein [Stylosanthes scabra]